MCTYFADVKDAEGKLIRTYSVKDLHSATICGLNDPGEHPREAVCVDIYYGEDNERISRWKKIEGQWYCQEDNEEFISLWEATEYYRKELARQPKWS